MEVENGLDSQNGLTFIDLFSGIGGFRLGLEQAGHTCKGHCEIDKYANISYAAIHQPKEGEWFASDITKVRAADIPRVDIWCFGFPCQDISTAGKQKGMREGTRSGLFFSVAELIRQTAEEDRPKYLFIENVKNLLSINSGWDFATILFELDELGYDAEWQVLNSKNFGVPQNRERVFIIGHFRGRSGGTVFPIGGENEGVIKQLGNIVKSKGGGLEPKILEDFYKGREVRTYENESPTLRADRQGLKLTVPSGLYTSQSKNFKRGMLRGISRCLKAKCHDASVAIPVLTPDRAEKRQNGRRFKTNGEPSFTLTAQYRHGVAIREATKKGYAVAEEGDSVNISFPDSKTRRGRVGKKIANTLVTGSEQGVVTLANGTKDGNTYCIDANYGKGTNTLNDGRRTMILKKPDWIPGPDDINRTLRKGGSKTLTPKHNYDSIYDGYRIRRLTPLECWRLQGFPDWAFDRAREAGVSDSQLYKQAGNSVTVNVIKAIGERLK